MKAIQKITAVFLALVFLFSSFGFTISSMVCLKSGKGKISLASIDDCCTKKNNGHSSEKSLPENAALLKKGSCCDINNYTIKLNDFQKSEKSISGQPVILQTLFNAAASLHVSKTSHTLAYEFADLPPPLYGRTLLHFISILLI